MAINEKDKYFTPDWLVKKQIKKTIEIVGEDNISDIVEPSAGDGAYIKFLSERFKDKDIYYYDLYPEHPEITQQDFLRLRKSYKKGRLIIGNPPYGQSSNLWRAFCKKSSEMGDYISFISPASQYNCNYYFKEGELVYSELLDDVEYRGSEEHGGVAAKVRTCLNIYKVFDRDETVDPRDAMIEQDISITGYKEGVHIDYNIIRWGDAGAYIDLGDKRMRQNSFILTILNEDIRDKVDKLVPKIKDIFRALPNASVSAGGSGSITIPVLKDILKTHLYPTRDERLEQDVKIKRVQEPGDFDFYIGRLGSTIGKYTKEFKYNTGSGIKILNENKRKEIEEFFETFREKYGVKMEEEYAGTPSLTHPVLKDILKTHLYPTRDERLEQDILFISFGKRDGRDTKTSEEVPDFYVKSHGSQSGLYMTEKDTVNCIGVKVINNELKDKTIQFFKNVKYGEYKKGIDGITPMPTISFKEIKADLIMYLYKDDDVYTPSWEEEYELKRAVKVIRKVYAKELF